MKTLIVLIILCFLGIVNAAIQAPTPISPKGYGIIANPSFSWGSISGATYDIQVFMADSISPVLNVIGDHEPVVFSDSFITNDSINIALNYALRYRWIIRARINGQISNWSTISFFQTKLPTPIPIYPANNATNISTNPTLTWSKIIVHFSSYGSFTYHIQISSNNSFSPVLIEDSTLTTPSKSISNLSPNSTYYWRIRANQCYSATYDDNSDWSNICTFITGNSPPQAPVLVSPLNGIKWVGPFSTTGSVSWLAVDWKNVKGLTYDVQIGNSDFSTILYENSTSTGNEYDFIQLPTVSLYYWRVRASNQSGSSSWSPIWNFSVGGNPPAPNLVAPSNQTILSETPTLVWNIVIGGNPTLYEVQVSTNQSFTYTIFDTFVGYSVGLGFSIDTTLYHNLSLGTYYWRIKTWVNNSGITSIWSPIWMFTISSVSIKNINNKQSLVTISKKNEVYYDIRGRKLSGITYQKYLVTKGQIILNLEPKESP